MKKVFFPSKSVDMLIIRKAWTWAPLSGSQWNRINVTECLFCIDDRLTVVRRKTIVREAPVWKRSGLFGHFPNGGGGLNACPDGLGHLFRDKCARKQVPQSARLSEGGGVRSLFGQCPNRPDLFQTGASLTCTYTPNPVQGLIENLVWEPSENLILGLK